MPKQLPLLALKQGAPTGTLGSEGRGRDARMVDAEEMNQLLRAFNAWMISFITVEQRKNCYIAKIVRGENVDRDYRQLASYEQACVDCIRYYKHQYYTFPKEMQLNRRVFREAIWKSAFPHSWMQCFVDMPSDPEKTVFFREMVVKSHGQLAVLMAHSIDESSCHLDHGPVDLYRRNNSWEWEDLSANEFVRTWQADINGQNIFTSLIANKQWPFQDAEFQTPYNNWPFVLNAMDVNNPFSMVLSTAQLQEVRHHEGSWLDSRHCFMYYYRYNFAHALLNLLQFALVGTAEGQYSTFDELADSPLGKAMQFMILNELTMTKIFHDLKRDPHAKYRFRDIVQSSGKTWNFALRFLLIAFTTDVQTKERYTQYEDFNWQPLHKDWMANPRNLELVIPVSDSDYIWQISISPEPARYRPIFHANYKILYLFCQEAYLGVTKNQNSVLSASDYSKRWNLWARAEDYVHPDTGIREKVPMVRQTVLESLHWLGETQNLSADDIRIDMRKPISSEFDNMQFTREQAEAISLFATWLDFILKLVKTDIEPVVVQLGDDGRPSNWLRSGKSHMQINPSYNPNLRKKWEWVRSLYEGVDKLVYRYREAEGLVSAVEDGMMEDDRPQSHLSQIAQRNIRAGRVPTDALASKMCELKL
ncbi:MAG: hypothetical protein CMM02_05055 [Rhodopirellula sp.]|nr:hypothetical protein [Rhodopirellula sp.]